MKIINPTDDQLDAAFAEHVAGQIPTVSPGYFTYPNVRGFWRAKKFTQSSDAVLPWLEKGRESGRRIGIEVGFRLWRIWIHDKNTDGLYDSCLERRPDGESDTLPRAAVIALLRAHGVEVEFTK